MTASGGSTVVGGGHDRSARRIHAARAHAERCQLALGQGRARRLVGAGRRLRVVDGVVEEQGQADRGAIGALDLGQQVVGSGQRGRHVGGRVVVAMGLAVTSQEAVERVLDLGRPRWGSVGRATVVDGGLPVRSQPLLHPREPTAMAVLVDEPLWWWRGRRWCHLVSDESLDELHAFARARRHTGAGLPGRPLRHPRGAPPGRPGRGRHPGAQPRAATAAAGRRPAAVAGGAPGAAPHAERPEASPRHSGGSPLRSRREDAPSWSMTNQSSSSRPASSNSSSSSSPRSRSLRSEAAIGAAGRTVARTTACTVGERSATSTTSAATSSTSSMADVPLTMKQVWPRWVSSARKTTVSGRSGRLMARSTSCSAATASVSRAGGADGW